MSATRWAKVGEEFDELVTRRRFRVIEAAISYVVLAEVAGESDGSGEIRREAWHRFRLYFERSGTAMPAEENA